MARQIGSETLSDGAIEDRNPKFTAQNHFSATAFGDKDFDGVLFKRAIAYGIDLVIIAILISITFAAGSIIGVLSFGLLFPIVTLVATILPFAYHTLTIGSPASATIGMRIMSIEVRTWDSRRPGYVQAAIQTMLFYGTIALTSFAILIVSLFNKRNRCLHDYLCGTVVINSPEPNPVFPLFD